MPRIPLHSYAHKSTAFPTGVVSLDDPPAGLPRVLLRRLFCLMKFPDHPAREAIIDTGSPLTYIPAVLWKDAYRWQVGRDFDLLHATGYPDGLPGQILAFSYTFRLARLRIPVELAGGRGPRCRLDALVVQLADAGGPDYPIVGLWGGALEGKTLAFDRAARSDDIQPFLEF